MKMVSDDPHTQLISEIVGATTPMTRRGRRFRAYFLERMAVDQSSTAPATESDTTEIAIELAQGQRLVVRGIEPGVIVEVAAWSGTGGPGDNAVRMLFGAGRTNSETTEIRAVGAEEATQDSPSMDAMTDADVRTLEEIDETVETADDVIRHKMKRRRTMVRRLLWTLGSIGLVAAIVAALSATNLVRFVHPDAGLTNTLGGAETTIAVVGPSVDLEPESSVLFTDNADFVLGGVIAVEEDKTLVYTGQGQIVVDRDDVVGRVLFVVPFLGLVAGAFGQ